MSHKSVIGATLLVAFMMVSGCQSSNNRWTTAWKDRAKPKPKFQGVDGPEQVTYWPYKASKKNPKMTEIPSQLKEKMARKSEQSKRDSQMSELIKEGDELRKRGQLEDARLVYTKAIMLSPESPDLHHRLAIVADKQHQYPMADEHYQAALKVRPRDPNLLSDLGYSYVLRGSTQQAEMTLKEALAIDKTHKGAMANLGAIYAQQNRFPEALEMFRNGATEAEAQQYIAKLFPQGRSGPGNGMIPDQGYSNGGPVIAARATDGPQDLTKMSIDQIQAQMSRLRQEAELRRQQLDQRRQQADQQNLAIARNMSDEDSGRMAQSGYAPRGATSNAPLSLGPQVGLPSGSSNNQQGTSGHQPGTDLSQRLQAGLSSPSAYPQGQPASGPQTDWANNQVTPTASASNTNRVPQPAEIFRGTRSQAQSTRLADSQIQPAWDQQTANSGANNVQQINASNNATQMAIQLGMSAGPGGVFPIVPASANDGGAPSGQPAAAENRFGNEFQQAPSYQHPVQNNQRWSGNVNDQSAAMTSENLGKVEGLPAIAPASPISQWDTPATGALNWQNDSSSPSNWTSGNPTGGAQASGGAGTGINSQSTQPVWGQGNNRRAETVDTFQPGINANRSRTNNEGSRPFNGAWPNSNAIPQTQNQPNILNNRSPETLEMMGINPQGGTGDANSFNQNGVNAAPANTSSNSLPQYPFAPNR